MSDFERILDGISEIKQQQAGMIAKQEAMHEGIGGINGRLDKLNGRVYGLEQNKADREDLKELRGRVWKIVLFLLGGGTAAGIGIKELFF